MAGCGRAAAVEAAIDRRTGQDQAVLRKLPDPSRNVVLLSVQYFLWSLGIYGFVFWLPSIAFRR